MKVVIAGGGTAGHVNPALALAEALSADVVFMGTERGAEARLVPAAGGVLETIEVAGFDRAKKWSFPATAWKAAGAVRAARALLKRISPEVVVGMGGYVSLPACFAARSLGIPIVLHEQNIVLGLANRVCKPLARKVAVSFEATLEQVPTSKGVHTGNPISRALLETDLEAARREALDRFELDGGRRTLLVFGGSLGAERINRAAVGLAREWSDRSDLQVLHICGHDHADALTGELADPGDLIYRLVPYVEDMGLAYGVADLALCRGGATTAAELCALGVPSVIVPYPYHRDRQQEKHGRVLEEAGAAHVLLDEDATTGSVATLTLHYLDDEVRLNAMAVAARSLGRPRAAESLADLVQEVAR